MSARKAATRQRILDAARQLFSEQPIRAVTVQRILEASPTSRRTFYQHFSGIEAVLEVLYTEHVDALVAALTEAIAEAPDRSSQVLHAVTAYVDFQRAGGALVVALQAESVRPDSALAVQRERAHDTVVGLLDASVRDALGVRLDPFVFRTLLMGIEGLVLHVQRQGTFSDADAERVLAVAGPMALNVLAAAPYLPTAD